MELKDIVLEKGDVVHYDGDYFIVAELAGKTADELEGCVSKIERPIKYEIIYEAPKEILDREEKEYLEHFLRPFKDKVKSIRKFKIWVAGRYNELIRVIYQSIRDSKERLDLPEYKSGTMYKGMEPGKEYTLEELGLFKE